MATILEEADDGPDNRVATIQTKRGEEFIVNIDHGICALVELLSDYDNEKRQGWTLNEPWIRDALAEVRRKAIVPSE